VDRLHRVHGDIARRYLDGDLDFPRAALAFERDALVPSSGSADATLKFLNRYRSYAATYTVGRDAAARYLDARSTAGDAASRWQAYIDLITDPAQIVPPEPGRQ
jgi:hypothetical protein